MKRKHLKNETSFLKIQKSHYFGKMKAFHEFNFENFSWTHSSLEAKLSIIQKS